MTVACRPGWRGRSLVLEIPQLLVALKQYHLKLGVCLRAPVAAKLQLILL